MPLQLSNRQPRPVIGMGTLMRLGSLAASLVLVGALMQSIRSPQSIARLDELFGSRTSTTLAPNAETAMGAARKLSSKIDRELLKSLNDDKPFRPAETEAWYHLLTVVRDTPDDLLREASLGQISVTQLMSQPGHYRGRVVTVSGLAHRVQLIEQSDNAHGISQVYEVVVQPGGRGSRSMLFHCLELPAGFRELVTPRPVQFDGLFLKNRVYGHSLGLDKAPVIVGRSFQPLDIHSRGEFASKAPSTPWLVGVAVASALVVGLLLRHALVAPRKTIHTASIDEPASIAAALRELEEGAARETQEGEST